MLKNVKGVTLLILVITIIVILILAGVIMNINMNANKTTDLKEVVVNMELIRTSAKMYREKYLADTYVNEEGKQVVSDKFIGRKLDVTQASDIIGSLLSYAGRSTIDENVIYWFRLEQEEYGVDGKDDLKTLGIDLKLNGEAYFVNYATLDVAYCKTEQNKDREYGGIYGKKKDSLGDEQYFYFYEDLKDLKTDEMSN